MKENYLAALWREMGAWKDVEAALQEQRLGIIQRQAEAIWSSQEALENLLRKAAYYHQEALECRPENLDDETQRVVRQVQRVQSQVQDALRLNFDLLRDLCSYMDMMREVVFPQTLPPTYDHLRRSRQEPPSLPGRNSRIA